MADWDSLARGFDDAFFEDPVYYSMLETMVNMVPDAGAERALDLGCGTGNLVSLLLERYPDMQIVGLDPSAGMREVGAERFRDLPNVEIAEGDALAVPFPDGSFDLVLSSLALHHVPPERKPALAKEIARVLRYGGLFIHADPFCGVPGSADDPRKARDVIEKMTAKALYSLEHGAWNMMLGELKAIPLVLQGEGEYLVTVEEWQAVLRDAGFGGFEVRDIPPVDLIKVISCTLLR